MKEIEIYTWLRGIEGRNFPQRPVMEWSGSSQILKNPSIWSILYAVKYFAICQRRHEACNSKCNEETMHWQGTKKSWSTRPVLNDHATNHSCPWTFLPSYKLGSPNSVHFCRNSLVVPRSRCSCGRELDIPTYPRYCGQLRLGDLLLILLLSFLRIRQLLITIITNIIIIAGWQLRSKTSIRKIKSNTHLLV